MSELGMQHWTGGAGLGFVALNMIVIPRYFVYTGPPPAWNVLTRILINMFALLGLIAFLVGFWHSILQARSGYGWLGTVCLVVGLAHTVLTFVAAVLQAGSVLRKPERIDPTLVGSGAEGSLIIYGPISRLLEAAFLASAGSVILITGMLPAWTGWLAFAVGVFQLALVPTLVSTTDPAHFYSVNGWGIPVAGSLFLAWIVVVSTLFMLIP